MPEELHPIVAQLTPNEEQRPAVSARGCDVVVTAGAGTGKTRTLVARYLSLLADLEADRRGHLRSIVAITFTRKAAREMRNRVRAEVRRYLAHCALTPQQRDRWQAVYARLDAARIGTIHSLCTEILRAQPAEASVDPRFQVLEEGQAALLRREVLDEALAWAADEPDAVRLFDLLDGATRLRGAIQTLLARRLDAASAFEALPADPLAYWREVLSQRKLVRLERLLSDPAWAEALTALRRSKPTDPDDRMALQRRWALAAIDEAVESRVRRRSGSPGQRSVPSGGAGVGAAERIEERLASLSRLDDVNLVGGSYRAWPGGKSEKAAVKDALRTVRKLWRDHADLLSLQLTSLDERTAEAIPGLRAVFRFARRRYQAEKRNRRVLDFDDLESGAVELLQDHPEVRTRWQDQVEAILVDEFQDTNERQRRLVHLLSGDAGHRRSSGKLFIVGDAKQSIYGFRGADVTVFRAERERIVGRDDGEGWPLTTSYRAHRDLVRALNNLLRPVLGEEADPHRPWAEPFAPIAAHRDAPGPRIEPPYVEMHLTVGSKSDGALDRAARALVGRLAEMVESGAQMADGGEAAPHGLRPLDYGDIAILCRASGSFGAYEDALDEAGLPYVTVAGRGFYDRPEIRDLLNALRALADPTDDLALVGLLRSPAVALSDAAIYRLVRGRGEAPISLWQALSRGDADLGIGAQGRSSVDPVAGQRVARSVSLITELHTMAGRTGVGDLLKAFLDATTYRAALLKAGQQRAVRNVQKLLGDAHASGLVSVGAFLEYVDGLRDSGAREGEARAVSGDAVQIMTIHQAKGLEFPIVVLGDATWSGGGGGSRPVLIDPTLGVLPPLPPSGGDDEEELAAVYCLAQAREEDQAAAESDRLLYVAATRAREKLLVSGCLSGIRKDGTPYKPGGWLDKLGRPLGLHEIEIPYDEQGSLVHHRELRAGETTVGCLIYEPAATTYEPATPLVTDAVAIETPLPPPLLAPVTQTEAPPTQREAPQQVWRVVPETRRPRAPSRTVGQLVHEALAAWRLPQGRDDEPFEEWLRARARAAGLVDRQQIADARRRVRRLLLQLQEHPLFEDLTAAQQRLHEVPYTLEQQGRLENGQIDLLYRRRDIWSIVEFKTDEVRHATRFEQLLRERNYVPQARRYAEAIEQLLGTRPRCLLCMLDYERRTRVYAIPAAGPLERVDRFS
jgi:ATP-dependent helicase/nuclease subunit A